MKTEYLKIGEIIAHLRKSRKMTQRDLAHSMGISNQAVSKWESGLSYPDIAMLPVLADLFEVTIDTLFDRDAPWIETEYVPALSEIPPWPDDDGLYGVLYQGHRLLAYPDGPRRQNSILEDLYARTDSDRRPVLIYSGDVSNIVSCFDIRCTGCMIKGSVTASGNVICSSVGGKVYAGGNVSIHAASGQADPDQGSTDFE